MGRFQAEAFAQAVTSGDVTLEAALEWHLTANCFPPLPTSWVPVAAAAVRSFDDPDWQLALPQGIERQQPGPEGLYRASVAEIIEALQIESFVDCEDEL